MKIQYPDQPAPALLDKDNIFRQATIEIESLQEEIRNLKRQCRTMKRINEQLERLISEPPKPRRWPRIVHWGVTITLVLLFILACIHIADLAEEKRQVSALYKQNQKAFVQAVQLANRKGVAAESAEAQFHALQAKVKDHIKGVQFDMAKTIAHMRDYCNLPIEVERELRTAIYFDDITRK